ncbi:MAG: DUF3060 domain-containing protein [Mycobacterium sp.]|nr:DUF3060 domain-containing protein [Mycobacterium sp.]HKI39327.1 DUF3060 domain-containing protein [Mycobacterium sp.]
MDPQDDPEKRIRELERPLADAAHASESGSPPPGAPPPPATPAGAPWTYGGPFMGPPPQRPSGNRMWWILGTVIVIGTLALAGGIAAFAAHQFSGVRSIIESPPTAPGGTSSSPRSPGPSASRAKTPGPSTSPAPPPGARLSVSGINENRTIACDDNIVSVSGVSNTVVITGHCTQISVSGVQNSITVDSVDAIDASGFNNKVTYHSGTPEVGNSGDSNVVEQG